MQNRYHILNGDALRDTFPRDLMGEIIVFRECLVDGDVKGDNLTELFSTRSKYLSNNYNDITSEEYYDKSATEIKKITSINDNAEIYLWFEDDLFCQVNLWFVINLLQSSIDQYKNRIFLIRPKTQDVYGFGSYDENGLIKLFEQRILITKIDKLANLWIHYQSNKPNLLLESAQYLEDKYPFIVKAVKAHMDRIPTKDDPGRPRSSLVSIMSELKTKDFGLVFREFCARESIYGFGDLHVKRLYDELIGK